MTVRNRPHDRTDRQAVEIVVDENQDSQDNRRELSAHACLDMILRPAAEGCRTARFVHHRDDGAEHNQKYQNTDVIRIRHGRDDSIRKDMQDRLLKIKVRREKTAYHNTDKQGRINFLCNQRQTDRDQRRNQRPYGVVKMRSRRDLLRRILSKYRHHHAERQNRSGQHTRHKNPVPKTLLHTSSSLNPFMRTRAPTEPPAAGS